MAISRYNSIRPKFQGPYLCHISGSPLTSFQFSQVLKKSLNFIGIDTATFKTHSFRIGAATQMYLDGQNEETIKLKGRWKSNVVKSYIRI